MKKFMIYKYTDIYNTLDADTLDMDIKQFKKAIKILIWTTDTLATFI